MRFPRPRATSNRIKNARILVVEDNQDHLLLIKNAIQRSFTNVESVLLTSEKECINYLDECIQTGLRLPQFILLDLYLPKRENGWNLLAQIKERKSEIGQIPTVIFSHSEYQEDIMESYDRGVTSYVVKPTDFNEWLAYFETLKEYWWETVSFPASHSI